MSLTLVKPIQYKCKIRDCRAHTSEREKMIVLNNMVVPITVCQDCLNDKFESIGLLPNFAYQFKKVVD